MRLKQHREDVKDLRLMADPHVHDISKRYLNLIRAAEKGLETGMKYYNREYANNNWSKEVKRVLKDAE